MWRPELAFHVEMRIRELIEHGEAPERARRIALRRFGDYEAPARRASPSTNDGEHTWIAPISHRAEAGHRVCGRMMRRTPRSPRRAPHARPSHRRQQRDLQRRQWRAAAIAPFRDAERLHVLQMLYPDGAKYSSLSAPDFMSVRADQRVFDAVEAMDTPMLTLLGAGEPREVSGAFVSGGMLEMLGTRVALGRGFLPEENQPNRGQVALLTHGLWQRVFGDPACSAGRITTGGSPTRSRFDLGRFFIA